MRAPWWGPFLGFMCVCVCVVAIIAFPPRTLGLMPNAAPIPGNGEAPLGTWVLRDLSVTFRSDGTTTERRETAGDGHWYDLGHHRIKVVGPKTWEADWVVRDGGAHLSLRNLVELPPQGPPISHDSIDLFRQE